MGEVRGAPCSVACVYPAPSLNRSVPSPSPPGEEAGPRSDRGGGGVLGGAPLPVLAHSGSSCAQGVGRGGSSVCPSGKWRCYLPHRDPPVRTREGSPGEPGVSCESPPFRGSVLRFRAQRSGFGPHLSPQKPQQPLNCFEARSPCLWTRHVSQVCQSSRLGN